MGRVVVLMMCAWGLTAAAVAGPREDGQRVIDAWVRAFSSSDVDGIVALYAGDTLFMGTGSRTVVTSTSDIRTYFERALLTDRPRTAQVLDVHTAELGDGAMMATGLDAVSLTRDGKVITQNGRFTFVVARRGAEWKIVHFHRSAMPGGGGR